MLSDGMQKAGKAVPEVIPLNGLPLDDPAQAIDRLQGMAEVGVTGITHAGKYENTDEFRQMVEALLDIKSKAGLA